MARLIIKQFSCIDEADIDLAPLTILTGPQASGKSVISKLTHFFYDCIINIGSMDPDFDFEETSVQAHSKMTVDSFKKHFPSQAWGVTAFDLRFIAGPVTIRISRSKPRKNSIGSVKIEFSEYFCEMFNFVQEQLLLARKHPDDAKNDRHMPTGWDQKWKIRRSVQNKLRDELKEDYVRSQLFIPAGRSFFTSLGKAVPVFEHGGYLDPLTIAFGQFFLITRESLAGRSYFYRSATAEKVRKELEPIQSNLSEVLFSGKIKVEKNEEYVDAPDGRRIPFSFLSSGQLELLPLWLAVNQFFDGDAANQFVYIEETEAHLFPSTQGDLMQYLVTLLGTSPSQRMLITTHSPYVLGKINNLVKAGSLAGKRSKRDHTKIDRIISKSSWLKPGMTTAYAIINRRVVSIIDEGGLIDGEYLDDVSGDILRDYNQLLEIEYGQ